jgi:hypothetical protein
MNQQQLLKSTLEHPYDKSACFLCGVKLVVSNRTEEHIFPKWLQHKYSLWEKKLILLNETTIAYKDLRIPCCKSCNNELLSEIELKVQYAFNQGYEEIVKTEPTLLYRWISKIFLGIIYKELFLFYDRRDEALGTILDPEFLKRYSLLHFWILSLRNNLGNPFVPGSIFIFKSQVPDEIQEQYHFLDDSLNGVVSIRIGQCLIVVDFLENGLHKEMLGHAYEKYSSVALHPFQCLELIGHIIYNAKRLCLETDVEFRRDDEKVMQLITWQPILENGALFSEWIQEDFAMVLSEITKIPFKQLYFDGKVRSFLKDENGQVLFWKFGEAHPLTIQE